MNIRTYLFFDGCCEDAIRFYGSVFGAELTFLMRFKDGPPELMAEGAEEKIFHATMKFGETLLNMSDAVDENETGFGGFGLLSHIDDEETANCVFEALSIRGQVKVPLQPTFWAALYGIVQDRFGVTWKIQVDK